MSIHNKSVPLPNLGDNQQKSGISNAFVPSDDNNYFVKSLAKALMIFECFDDQNTHMTLTEVSKKTNVTRAAARRFLLTLVDMGYATHWNRKFSLTSKVLSLSQGFQPHANIWDIAEKHMKELVDNVDEACSAVVLNGTDIEYLVRIGTPNRIMSVTPQVGSRSPAHLNSTGRAILAHCEPQILENYIRRAEFKKLTEFSIDTPNQLRSAIDKTKADGYAILNQELEIGLRSIAIPLFDHNAKILGALTVGTHISRVTENNLIETILPALHTCSQAIAQELSTT